MKEKKTIILITIFSLCASVMGFSKNYTVVVHPDNPTQTITSKDLQKIFLGEKTTWENGQPLKVAALKDGETHKEFLKDIVKISPMKFTIYWKQKIFTGTSTGSQINFFKTEDKLKEYIKANPSVIGYISNNAIDNTVKEVKITE